MNKNNVKALKKMLENSQEDNTEHKSMHKFFECRDGRLLWLSNHYAFRIWDVIEDLPIHRPGSITPLMTEQFEKVQGYLQDAMNNGEEWMEYLSLSQIRQHIKDKKTERGGWVLYNYGIGLPTVAANYLVDILRVFPDAKFARPRKRFSPVYFKAKNGDGMLMPVRTKDV